MSVKRKEIRNKVVSLIKRAKTNAGDNVVANRTRPPWKERLPAVSVRTEDETVAKNSETPRDLRRELSLVIEINDKAKTEDDLSDQLDETADQIEDGLFSDDTLGNTANEIHLRDIDLDLQPEGEKIMGALKINFGVVYYEYRPSNRFNQKLDDFETANVKYEMSDDDDVPIGEDTIDMT